MINFVIGVVALVGGFYFLNKFTKSSPSLKTREEHNKKNPTDDAYFPPNNGNGPSF
ncbi:MAG: hypothetical protein ABF649_09415 [Bacillus sp. (in: firmicutes)]